MSTKTASIISSIFTGVLIILGILILEFATMIALNGVMVTPTTEMAINLTCMGSSLILSVILAWILPKFLITKFNWKGWLAILVSILVTSTLGIVLGIVNTFGTIILIDTTY